jgi:hypothetical protein
MSSNFDDDMFDSIAPRGTVEFTLDGVYVRGDQPLVLQMRHAGESNPEYMNARRKVDNALRATTGDPSNAEVRRVLIPVFAETVITGWRNAIGRDGKPIPYNADEGAAFLRVLVRKNGDIVSRAMAYALDADRFRAPIGTAEALGNG